jgi:O-antigen/teichoic acid export membrane protein
MMKSDILSNIEHNKRITRNTLVLYIRMFIMMGISLYTSRIVLKALGVSDYGIYNIVGGIVAMFSFLNTAMSSATQRFLNFEMGKGNDDEVKRVFSMSMTAHISIVLLVIVLGETVGLWFLNSHLNIPAGRMNAANWVYQFSILTFCIQIICVPYNASIIAYEKMSFYAYISIIDATLKLLIVFLLLYLGWDKLKLYAVLICSVTLISLMLYKIYCNRAFTTCEYHYFWDASLYRKLISFSGWSLFGSLANVGAQQGLNILVNIFYGVTVNAAMGIANSVSTSIYGFVANFQTAFKPQIIKSYASNDRIYFMNLIFQASKFSYYLLFLLSVPALISMEFILNVWLHIVPEHSASFCRLIIFFLLIDAISSPLWMSVQATGKIRNYQILMGSLIFINLPLAYISLKLGFNPESVLLIRVIINLITYITRIIYLRPKIGLPVRRYIREVILPVSLVTLIALPLPLIVNQFFSDWSRFILTTLMALLSTISCVYFIGLRKSERDFVNHFILNKIRKWYH